MSDRNKVLFLPVLLFFAGLCVQCSALVKDSEKEPIRVFKPDAMSRKNLKSNQMDLVLSCESPVGTIEISGDLANAVSPQDCGDSEFTVPVVLQPTAGRKKILIQWSDEKAVFGKTLELCLNSGKSMVCQ